jgi:hypothetical protein
VLDLGLSRVDNKVEATWYVDGKLAVGNEKSSEGMAMECEHGCSCNASESSSDANGANFR